MTTSRSQSKSRSNWQGWTICKSYQSLVETRSLTQHHSDLYLIHGPQPNEKMRLECWRAIEDAVAEGTIRAAGVSNFGIRHLEQLHSAGLKVPIALNQIDLHPFMRRDELVEYCHSKGIVMEVSYLTVHHIGS